MRWLVLFLFAFLFAENIYISNNITVSLPKFYHPKPLDKKPEDFVAILSLEELPRCLDRVVILKGLMDYPLYIVTFKDKLSDIKTVANANLPAKIFFSSVGNVRYVNGDIDDLINKKVDAVV
ncbi:MAG: hypothetical protein GXO62_06530, partial [Epsilonproteobacteria bacterium]|nr:hypothetical protein [Campylobacterota bacterium]